MKKTILLFTTILLMSSFAFAAFPVTGSPESITEIAKPIFSSDSPWPNIVSLSCAVLALLLPVELAILAGILFIVAIVFGAMGFSKSLKGMGIAGFVVGILGLIAVLILTEGFMTNGNSLEDSPFNDDPL